MSDTARDDGATTPDFYDICTWCGRGLQWPEPRRGRPPTMHRECAKAKQREYQQRPEVKAKQRDKAQETRDKARAYDELMATMVNDAREATADG